MGHVGQKFRFVFRRQRQFGGFFLERAAGHCSTYLIFALHLDVLLGELARLLRQFLVGLLEFFLLRLQFNGELLRLLQKTFSAHGRFNGVEDDADGLRQLFKESEMRHAERAQAVTPIQ